MEVVYHNLVEHDLVDVEHTQLKADQKIEIAENMKKIVSVTCQLREPNTEIKDGEAFLRGNIVTRVIFINDIDKYDSKDIVVPLEKKLTLPDTSGFNSVACTVKIVDSKWSLTENAIAVTCVFSVMVSGVKESNERLVSDLTGEVEVKQTEHKLLSFNTVLHDEIEIEENIELEPTCEGVLGVDANAFIKDITCGDGKVTVKGVVAVNMVGVKTVDSLTMPYHTTGDIDFAKTISVAGVTSEDLAHGQVTVKNVSMHIENSSKGSVLVLNVVLIYHGCACVVKTFNTIVDAIAFDQELSLETNTLSRQEMLPQINTTLDLENNVNLPTSTPYVARVLAVDGAAVNHVNVSAADNKITLEGVLTANVLVENEEHLVANQLIELPFQHNVRVDAWDGEITVQADVKPLLLNVKARRGVELLVDAKLGVEIQCRQQKTIPVVTSVVVGANKVEDDSAIRIYIVGEKEDLWSLAKRTNLSRAALLKQNPNLENGCTPGERIVVYRHECVSF